MYRWGRIGNWLTIVGASLRHIILFCPLLCIWGILYKYKVKENSIYVNCVSTAAGWTKETKKLLFSLGRDRRTFSQVSKTCLCSFSKSHFEKQVTIPPTSASAGENAQRRALLGHVITVPKESSGSPLTPVFQN